MSTPYRVIITGDRHWYCESLAYKVVQGLKAKHGAGVVIVEGGADGVDHAFHVAANGCDLATERHPAEWGKFGKRAGPERNARMVARGADLCIAVHPNIDVSRGTKDCVRKAITAGIPVWLIENDDCKPIRLSWEDVASGIHDVLRDEARERSSSEAVPNVVQSVMRGGREVGWLDDSTDVDPELAARSRPGVAALDQIKDKARDIYEADLSDESPDSLWGVIADEVERTNSAWMADHADAPEVVRWEEAVLHLAHYARKARMHKLDLAKCGPQDVIGTLIELGKNKFKRSHLEKELRSFMSEAVRVAKDRRIPRRTRGPR